MKTGSVSPAAPSFVVGGTVDRSVQILSVLTVEMITYYYQQGPWLMCIKGKGKTKRKQKQKINNTAGQLILSDGSCCEAKSASEGYGGM
jgi:hypothetical protein